MTLQSERFSKAHAKLAKRNSHLGTLGQISLLS